VIFACRGKSCRPNVPSLKGFVGRKVVAKMV
jgi:hypothetical protein